MTCTACSATLQITVGNAVTGTCTITDAKGNLFDPANVFAWSYSLTTGVLTSLTVTRVSQGVYTATFTPTGPGPWVMRFSDSSTPPTGATVTVEEQFNAQPLLF